MAGKSEVYAVFSALRDDLQSKIDSGDFNAWFSELRRLHLAVASALRAFQQRPWHGDSSDAYDAAVAAGSGALNASRSLRPADQAALQRLQQLVVNAARELGRVTAPALYGSLAIRRGGTARPQPRVRANARPANAGANAPPAPPPTDPAEPYLSSLAKLFPAEALSALLLVLSINEDLVRLRIGLVVIIAIALVALRSIATWNLETRRPDVLAVVVSVVSFVIYAAAMLAFGEIFHDEPTTRIVATVAGILWLAILTEVIRRKPIT